MVKEITDLKSLESKIVKGTLIIQNDPELEIIDIYESYKKGDIQKVQNIIIRNLPSLKKIDFNNKMESIRIERGLENLNVLDIKDCKKLVVLPQRFKNIEKLHFSDIESLSIKIDENYDTLKRLSLARCIFHDNQLTITSNIKELNYLSIVGCNLIKLIISFEVKYITDLFLENNDLEELIIEKTFENLTSAGLQTNNIKFFDFKIIPAKLEKDENGDILYADENIIVIDEITKIPLRLKPLVDSGELLIQLERGNLTDDNYY